MKRRSKIRPTAEVYYRPSEVLITVENQINAQRVVDALRAEEFFAQVVDLEDTPTVGMPEQGAPVEGILETLGFEVSASDAPGLAVA